MSNVEAFVKIVLEHVDFGVRMAKTLGLGELLPDEVTEAKAKVMAALDDKLSEILPLAIVGVAVGAVAVAVKADAAIESLGKSPRCPNGHMAKQTITVTPGGGESTVTLSCDACAWSLP